MVSPFFGTLRVLSHFILTTPSKISALVIHVLHTKKSSSREVTCLGRGWWSKHLKPACPGAHTRPQAHVLILDAQSPAQLCVTLVHLSQCSSSPPPSIWEGMLTLQDMVRSSPSSRSHPASPGYLVSPFSRPPGGDSTTPPLDSNCGMPWLFPHQTGSFVKTIPRRACIA